MKQLEELCDGFHSILHKYLTFVDELKVNVKKCAIL
jgi:hypothetical protein